MRSLFHQPGGTSEFGQANRISRMTRPDVSTPTRILVPLRRVLIVDFRDEVYACLRSELLRMGVRVARAASADEAAHVARRFAPQLVLVNAEMPDESGWLICAKLQIRRAGLQVWVYGARIRYSRTIVTEGARADEVIEYEGVLFRLIERIGRALRRTRRTWASSRTRPPLRKCSRFDAPCDLPTPRHQLCLWEAAHRRRRMSDG